MSTTGAGKDALGRRIVSITLYAVLMVTVVTTFPALLLAAWVSDLVRGSKAFVATRCVVFFPIYLIYEMLGLLFAGIFWTLAVVTGRLQSEWYLAKNYWIQKWWLNSMYQIGKALFSVDVQLEQPLVDASGPMIVLIRHVSMADTLLPSVFITRPYGTRLRYVLKSGLLWDPCMDIVGHRIPNVFVKRGAGKGDVESQRIGELVRGMGPNEGALIYPEGTRYSAARRIRALERIKASGDTELLARAEKLQHVLPPRLTGITAILDSAPNVDIVMFAHAGFEGTRSLASLWRGEMVGSVVKIGLWRIRASEIPTDPRRRALWIYEQWGKLDEWVGAHLPSGTRADEMGDDE